VRVGGPLKFDAQLNDVRFPDSPPLDFFMEVGFRVHPSSPTVQRARAALLTLGNPWPGEEDPATGRLRLSLAHGRKSTPTLFYFGATLPIDAFIRAHPPTSAAGPFMRTQPPRGKSAPPSLSVLDAWVHSHQRLARAFFIFSGRAEDIKLLDGAPLPALSAPYVPHVLRDRAQLESIVRQLERHPQLRCSSVHPGLEHVPASSLAPEGWYDRQPPTRCSTGWAMSVGSPLTAVFLDDYHGAPAAAAHRRLEDAINGMSGYISDALYPDILPQHYIARLLVVAQNEVDDAEGGWQPSCACVGVYQYVNVTASKEEGRWDAMRSFALYRPALDARPSSGPAEAASTPTVKGMASKGPREAHASWVHLPFSRMPAPERGAGVEKWQWAPHAAMCG